MSYMASLITNLVLAIFGKSDKMTKVSDFALDWTGDKKNEKKKQTPEEMAAIVRELARTINKANEKKVSLERMRHRKPRTGKYSRR